LGRNLPKLRLRFSKRIGQPAATWLAALACCLQAASTSLADERGWDLEPYRIRAVVAIDVAGGLAEHLARELPRYLRQRVNAAIGPAWSFDVEIADGVLRHVVFANIATESTIPSAQIPSGEEEKLLLVAVRNTPAGFQLTAREYDRFVEHWGMPIQRESRQSVMLAEQLFALATRAVAPLARVELDPNDEERVILQPRAAALLRVIDSEPSTRQAEVYLPILRRTLRSGELAEGGLQEVPWTYIEAAPAENGKLVGRIHSGNRTPFGVRRHGRVEQLAIAIRSDPSETQLWLQSRTNPEKPLVGYEVFSRGDSDDATARIGTSDSDGRVAVPPGESRIEMLFIKNGGRLLAKLPVVPGAVPELHVPLPDDEMRLAAEARMAALREELVDVVARRNILMARVRQKIEKDDFTAAQELLRVLDELPGRSQFDLTLQTAARLLRSDDPQIQRRIDQLFEATRTVLAQYLDSRPINELHAELRAAQRQ
jgi:hypothetical protein